MKYILHIDTSAEAGMIAIAGDGLLIAARPIADARSQGTVINLLINEAVQEAGISLKELNAVAVCSGPGSYTGLRIGMATAKALCYVLDIPLMLHDKLTLLALEQFVKHNQEYDQYISLLVARDKEYFISIYDNTLKKIVAPTHILEEDLIYMSSEWMGKIIICGDIWPGFINDNALQITHIDSRNPDLKSWVPYTFQQMNASVFENISTAEPLYLKQVYTHNNKNAK